MGKGVPVCCCLYWAFNLVRCFVFFLKSLGSGDTSKDFGEDIAVGWEASARTWARGVRVLLGLLGVKLFVAFLKSVGAGRISKN